MYQTITPDTLCNELKTINDWVRYATSSMTARQCFFGHGTDNAYDEALNLILHALSLDYEINTNLLKCRLTNAEKQHLANLLQQRIEARVPTPYLINRAYFAGLPFYVDRRVIIPRSPMAELIEERFEPWHYSDSIERVLDLCTGSGCIAIACAYHIAEAEVDAIELSDDAIAVAEKNISDLQLREVVNLIKSDLFSAIAPEQQYDIIVSNPPYVDEDEIRDMPAEFTHEPRMALESGKDGLEHVKRILAEAKDYLKPEGKLFVEVGASAPTLEEAFPEVPFTWIEFERGGFGVFIMTREELEKYFA